MVDFVDYLIPQSAATSDIDIASADGNTIPWELLTTIREMDGVKEVYGRRSVFDVSAKLNDDTNFSGTVDLISYDDFDLQCLKKDSALKRGVICPKFLGTAILFWQHPIRTAHGKSVTLFRLGMKPLP